MNKLIIEGRDLTKFVRGLQDITFDIENTSNASALAISATLDFFDVGYEFLKQSFFSDCGGNVVELLGVIQLDNCANIEVVIRADAVTHKTKDCEFSANITNVDNLNKIINYLQRTTIGDNGFDTNVQHPRVRYASQPGFIIYFLVIFRGIIQFILTTINVLVTLVTFGQVSIEWGKRFDEFISGTGRYIVSPLIRDIFNYHCGQLNIQFISSIFNSDTSLYSNAALFLNQNTRGARIDSNQNWISDNNPFDSLEDILNELAILFNAEWKVINDKLYFERWDYFQRNAEILLTVDETLENEYSFDVSRINATFNASYARDGFDSEGNNSMNYGYTETVNWNPNEKTTIRGVRLVKPQFAPMRGSYDRVTLEDSRRQRTENLIFDEFRAGRGTFAGIDPTGGFGIKTRADKADDIVIIDKDVCSELKVIVLRRGFSRTNAKVIRREILSARRKFYDYNYPMYFTQDYPENTLYANFFEIDDPNNGEGNIILLGNTTFDLDCSNLNRLIDNAPLVGIQTRYGVGIADRYTVDVRKCQITADSIKILCNFTA